MNNAIWIAAVRTVVESSVQSAALAVCVGGILAAARIRSGAVRHGAWVAVLCGMMMMPLLSRIEPKVDVPIQIPALETTDESAAAPRGVKPIVVVAAGQPPKFIAPKRSFPASTPAVPWVLVSIGLYGAGVLLLLARLIPGWQVVRHITRGSVPAPFLISGAIVCESELVSTPLTVGLLRPGLSCPRHGANGPIRNCGRCWRTRRLT